MKGCYSRGKREEMENKLRLEQKKFEAMMQQARSRQREIIKETHDIRNISKVTAAQIRIQEIQRQEEDRRKRKDHRDQYINFLRGNQRAHSREREISALDLQISEPTKKKNSKIPMPQNHNQIECRINTPNTKIPRFLSNLQEDKQIWGKGDLLDSLDLSNTNINHKQMKETSNNAQWNPTEKENWLEKNIRDSIKEWAPQKVMQAISEEIENKEMQIIKPTKRITKVLSVKKQVEKTAEQASEKQKPSKFVTRIRNIGNPEPDIEFLNVELDCVNEAENKIEASLARLDIKAIKAKCMSEVSALNQEVEQLEGSLNRLNLELAQKPDNKLREIPEKIAQDLQDKKTDVQNQDFNELKIERRFDLVEKNLVAHNDNQKFPVKTTHNSRYAQISDEEFSDNLSKYESRSIYSAHPYPRKQLIDEDLQSVISVVPVKRDASVFEGGSVFGDNTSTRSKKYSIIHKKESQQKLMSMRGDTSSLSDTKSVSGDIVHINPNVNLKALFFDDIEE